ncbi:hypothetical protein JMUB6875_27450 [Nocardia sp. JMUB6875]|uniref:hypothetical protein n=1 Tax=Nocardia sp. JMUB6875 TaxID=3158170 RepID=UPI0032E5753E
MTEPEIGSEAPETGNEAPESPDPRARWRTLPPEPTEWIEMKDREPSSIDFGSGHDPDRDIYLYGTGGMP